MIPPSGKMIPPSGKMNRASGKTVRASGKTIPPSGKTIRASGKTIRASGKTIRPSGKTIRASGKTVRASGKTVRAVRKVVSLLDAFEPLAEISGLRKDSTDHRSPVTRHSVDLWYFLSRESTRKWKELIIRTDRKCLSAARPLRGRKTLNDLFSIKMRPLRGRKFYLLDKSNHNPLRITHYTPLFTHYPLPITLHASPITQRISRLFFHKLKYLARLALERLADGFEGAEAYGFGFPGFQD